MEQNLSLQEEQRMVEREARRAEREASREASRRYYMRMSDAARRILEVATELHLTWHELEIVLSDLKDSAYICSKSTETGEMDASQESRPASES